MRRKLLTFAGVLLLMSVISLAAYNAGFQAGTARDAAAATASAAPFPGTETAAPGDAAQRFEPFWETWRLVEREFYDKDAVDLEKMTYGAIRGMLQSLGDQHTTFETPSHARHSADDMHGSFDGVGITVAMQNNRLTVVSPIDDSPGAKAGIRAGDVIVKIDDREAAELTLLEAISLIRGKRGTVVRLTIDRPGEPEPLLFEIERAEIKMSLVSGELMDDVAYVKLVQFAEPTANALRDKLKELLAAQPKAVILDVRNNPGGLLVSAVNVTSQFMSEGVVLYEQRRDGPTESFRARRGGQATTIPVIVLINRGSASAAEIVAGALQDNRRATLIGERSFGKDTVQNVHVLSDQSSVRVTVAKWFTPQKQPISGRGLVPDIEVSTTEDDIEAGRDPQLERALIRARTGQ